MRKETIDDQIKEIASQVELDSRKSIKNPSTGERFTQINNSRWIAQTYFDASGGFCDVNPEFGETLTKVRDLKLNQK